MARATSISCHLGLSEFPAGDEPLPSGGVAHGDGGDPVGLPERVAEFEMAVAVGFDVDLHALQVAEAEPQKVRLAGEQQILLDRVAEVKIGDVRCAGVLASLLLQIGFRVFELSQVGKKSDAVERRLACQRFDFGAAAPALETLLAREQEHRAKLDRFGRDPAGLAAEDPDPVQPLDLERDQPRSRVVAEENFIVLERKILKAGFRHYTLLPSTGALPI